MADFGPPPPPGEPQAKRTRDINSQSKDITQNFDILVVINRYNSIMTNFKYYYKQVQESNNIPEDILIAASDIIKSNYDWEIKDIFKIQFENNFTLVNENYILTKLHNANELNSATEERYNRISQSRINNENIETLIETINTAISDTQRDILIILQYISSPEELQTIIEQIIRTNQLLVQYQPTQNIWEQLISMKFISNKLLNFFQDSDRILDNLLNQWFGNSKTRTNTEAIAELEALAELPIPQLPENTSPTDIRYLLDYPVTNIGIVITANSYTKANQRRIGGLYLSARFTNIEDAEQRQLLYTQSFPDFNKRLAEANKSIEDKRTELTELYKDRKANSETIARSEQELHGLSRNMFNLQMEGTIIEDNNMTESRRYKTVSPNNLTDLHISIHLDANPNQSHITFNKERNKFYANILFILINDEIKIVNKIKVSQDLVHLILNSDFDPNNQVHLSFRNPIIHFLRGFEKYLTYIKQEQTQQGIVVAPHEVAAQSVKIENISYIKYLKYKNKYLNLKKLFDKLSMS
jgi:hypothetical protein